MFWKLFLKQQSSQLNGIILIEIFFHRVEEFRYRFEQVNVFRGIVFIFLFEISKILRGPVGELVGFVVWMNSQHRDKPLKSPDLNKQINNFIERPTFRGIWGSNLHSGWIWTSAEDGNSYENSNQVAGRWRGGRNCPWRCDRANRTETEINEALTFVTKRQVGGLFGFWLWGRRFLHVKHPQSLSTCNAISATWFALIGSIFSPSPPGGTRVF